MDERQKGKQKVEGMTTGWVYLIIFGILMIASFILAAVVTKTLNSEKNIDLVGGLLENSDASISDAMPYLKITNKWSK